MNKTTVLIVLKRLALSRQTYKLIGLLAVACGFLKGSEVMQWVSIMVCVASLGCTD